MTKVIAYSLWGDNPKYTLGAIKNSREVQIYYPGWTARFYCAMDVVPPVLDAIRDAGAQVIVVPEAGNNTAMFWRFYALEDPDVTMAIFRDTDSRLSTREAEAVQEWVRSGKTGHIMRDHPYHVKPILGGMWGSLAEPFRDIRKRAELFAPEDAYDQDQRFLEEYIYPELLQLGVHVHDSFYHFEKTANQFSTARENYSFIGEVFEADETRGPEWKAIRLYEKSAWKRFRFAVKRLLLVSRHRQRFNL